jgi:hypothetical protein
MAARLWRSADSYRGAQERDRGFDIQGSGATTGIRLTLIERERYES